MLKILNIARRPLAALLLALVAAHAAHAGQAGDDLAKCLVKSRTADDKRIFVKWIFAISALNPTVSSVSTVSKEQRDEVNKGVAAIFENLLTKTCKTQTQDALKAEGVQTIQQSFTVLGQSAMQELFSDPGVRMGIGEFAKYMDQKKLQETFNPPAAEEAKP